MIDMTPDELRALAEAAIKAAAESTPEDRSDAPPRVGAAIELRDGRVVTAYRGESGPGNHAEFCLLEKKLKDVDLVGSTLFTTLEPCTRRGPGKTPCCDWIRSRKISRVIIGMIDPNPKIRGGGILKLRAANIDVGFFPGDLMSRCEDLNRHFSQGVLAAEEHDPEELMKQLARFSGQAALAEKAHQSSFERFHGLINSLNDQLREKLTLLAASANPPSNQAAVRSAFEADVKKRAGEFLSLIKATETRYVAARTAFFETLDRLPPAARSEFEHMRAKLLE